MTPDAAQAIRGARIAHLIESDGPGGAERVVIDLARRLQANGCYSLVVLPAHGEGWLAREAVAAGLPIERFELDRPVSPRCARGITTVLQRHRIELAHSHEFTMGVYAAWAAWRTGIGHVATMHGGRYYAGRLRRRLALRAALALGGQLVAVSDLLAGHLSRDLWIRRRRIATVPNGVCWTPGDRSAVRAELGLEPTERLILAVGNLYPVKGHRHLITALASIARQHPGVRVAIAGRGGLEEDLRAYAAALGLADRVRLLGLRGDIPSLLAAADVFVLPSLSEGLPLALLEAMFAGRAIVASDVGEVRTVLADGDAGILVPPGDAGALARALASLLGDASRAERLGERARQRAAAEYDGSHMLARYAGLYDTMLGRRGTGGS